MLFSITHCSIWRKSVVGKFVGIFSMFDEINSRIAVTPVVVSMFVYIDFVSAVKSRASSGKVICLRSFKSVVEFFK